MQKDIRDTLGPTLSSLFEKAIEGRVFPGAAVAVCVGVGADRQQFFGEYGSYSYEQGKSGHLPRGAFFDLASLTKPLATTLSLLHLYSQDIVTLDDRLDDLLEEDIDSSHRAITLRHLLCHSSGLAAYNPFFKKLSRIALTKRKVVLQKMILEEPLQYALGRRSLYSDLGFLLLGWVVEKKGKMALDRYSRENIFKPLALEKTIFFARLSSGEKAKDCVPTAFCTWRQKTVCGEVDDENAFCLDGVAGHAGLFGNTEGLLPLLILLLDVWRQRRETGIFSGEKLRQFLQRQDLPPGSTWALGFDTPSAANSSSGQYFSPSSVGHLGFTGTSFWIDPERDLVVVLLTNRVYPDRQNTRIRQFRPLFHDRVLEALHLV